MRVREESNPASISSPTSSSGNSMKEPINAEESPEHHSPDQILVQFCDSPIINREFVGKNFSSNQGNSCSIQAFEILSNDEVTVANFASDVKLQITDTEREDADPDKSRIPTRQIARTNTVKTVQGLQK